MLSRFRGKAIKENVEEVNTLLKNKSEAKSIIKVMGTYGVRVEESERTGLIRMARLGDSTPSNSKGFDVILSYDLTCEHHTEGIKHTIYIKDETVISLYNSYIKPTALRRAIKLKDNVDGVATEELERIIVEEIKRLDKDQELEELERELESSGEQKVSWNFNHGFEE